MNLSEYPKMIKRASSDQELELNREYSRRILEEVSQFSQYTNSTVNEFKLRVSNIHN